MDSASRFDDRGTSRLVLTGCGLMLVAAFFMPWIDIGGAFGASGYDIATSGMGSAKRYLLWLAPLVGAILALAALADPRAMNRAGQAAAAVVLLPTAYYLGKGLLFGTSWGLWMIVLASLALLVNGASRSGPERLLIPGIVLVAGFFFPWLTENGNFASWGASGLDIAGAPLVPAGLDLPNPKLAWLVPVAGLVAAVAAGGRAATARSVGVGVGVAVLGWLTYFFGKGIGFLTGWGFWLTLIAAFGALVVSARK